MTRKASYACSAATRLPVAKCRRIKRCEASSFSREMESQRMIVAMACSISPASSYHCESRSKTSCMRKCQYSRWKRAQSSKPGALCSEKPARNSSRESVVASWSCARCARCTSSGSVAAARELSRASTQAACRVCRSRLTPEVSRSRLTPEVRSRPRVSRSMSRCGMRTGASLFSGEAPLASTSRSSSTVARSVARACAASLSGQNSSESVLRACVPASTAK